MHKRVSLKKLAVIQLPANPAMRASVPALARAGGTVGRAAALYIKEAR